MKSKIKISIDGETLWLKNELNLRIKENANLHIENENLKKELAQLKFMIDNNLGWEDLKNDLQPIHQI